MQEVDVDAVHAERPQALLQVLTNTIRGNAGGLRGCQAVMRALGDEGNVLAVGFAQPAADDLFADGGALILPVAKNRRGVQRGAAQPGVFVQQRYGFILRYACAKGAGAHDDP